MKKLFATLALAAALCFVAGNTPAQNRPSDFATATATAGAATLDSMAGTITTESLVTAAAATYTLTLTNARVVSANCVVMATVANGTNTQGDPVIGRVTPGTGSVAITVVNRHASQAFNGTLKISFSVDACAGL